MEFFIEGAGFDDQAHINTILFESLQTTDLRLAGPTADSKFGLFFINRHLKPFVAKIARFS